MKTPERGRFPKPQNTARAFKLHIKNNFKANILLVARLHKSPFLINQGNPFSRFEQIPSEISQLIFRLNYHMEM